MDFMSQVSDNPRRNLPARLSTLKEQGLETDLEDTTAEERVGMMWQLALDAWAFMGEPVEPRLPRHVVRIHRGGG